MAALGSVAFADAVCEGAVVSSLGVSPGEAAIGGAVLAAGGEVIKLYKDSLTKKAHARGTDIDHCVQGQMLVLGPWEILDANAFEQRFGDNKDIKYAQFHNTTTSTSAYANHSMK